MPDPEANVDAYRTLGLQPGASMAEVKRAYRLLAKAFHPDSAGEAALPRFLAIHEAYDRLITGRPAAPRGVRSTAPAEPWRADPARARQARERARTARGGPASAGRGAAGAADAGGSARRGPAGAAGSGGAAGPAGSTSKTPGASGGGTRGAPGTRGSGRRHVRKATMGSTSYDEARDANDPTWSGASWYGPSSGEYWIVNPREYADPRKHGPEYQSRARRPLPSDALAEEPAGGAAPATTDTAESQGTTAGWTDPSPQMASAPRAARWGSSPSTSSWSAPAGTARPGGAAASDGPAAGRATRSGERSAPRGVRPDRTTGPSPRAGAPTGPSRAWLGGPADDPIRRLGLALVAWPPIGVAAAALLAAATGCPSSAASCGGPEPLVPLLAQAGILGVLLLFPPLTRILAGGALAVLAVLVPLAMFLVAMSAAGVPQGWLAWFVPLGFAWLVGVGWTVTRGRRSSAARAGP